MRKHLASALAGACLAALCLTSPASAAFDITAFDVTYTKEGGGTATQAGSHPFSITTNLQFASEEDLKTKQITSAGSPKDITVMLPPGLVGDRNAVPYCSNADFLLVDSEHTNSNCPNSAAIGVLKVRTPGETTGGDVTSAYNLIPPPGTAAKIGFVLTNVPVTLAIRVNPDPPHNLIATLQNTSNIEPLGGSELTIWGNPANSAHDSERGTCLFNDDICPVDTPERPFLTLPRSCEGPLHTTYKANSWEEPNTFITGSSESALVTNGCGKLGFGPTIDAKPSTERAESASGLNFNLDIDDQQLTDPKGKAQSDMKRAVVTLPEGVTLNPSAAAGLAACSPQQLAAESVDSQPGEGCPEASKVGAVEAETKLLAGEVLRGQVFVAQQDDPASTTPGAENPFDSLFAIYMVIKDPDLGLLVKLAGKVETDPVTGQLTTTFGEPGHEIPQFPVSHFRFRFREGPRGPLVTPPSCGSYAADVQLTPWANPGKALPIAPSFQITQGVGGSPCPAGALPFKPGLTAGSLDNNAGAYAPFYLRITRNDAEQEITRLDAVLPKGVVGKIAGLGRCPEAAIAAAKAKSGRAELANPSCPPATRVGSTLGGAGVGTELTYVPGSLYLAGPFAGSPLSVVAITPAVAGPFDAGTVVVRQGLNLDPTTGEVLIDGAASDPIPHILKGIPLRVRDLRVYVDRPNFTLNPTGCQPKLTKASIFGAGTDFFSAADNLAAAATSPYQATNCAALKFQPKLALELRGGTKRSDHPALRSVVTYPKGSGYANIGKAVVKLPSTQFIDNARIQTPCTRVQFNANSCPKGSILGTAKAVSPLLDEPLQGPVYFRSNGGERLLPDIVADLHGLFRVILVGKVDSVKGRLRTTFDQVPDAPVSRFTLNLKGGKQGLLVNSRNLCAKTLRADVKLTGQNGRAHNTQPAIKTSCKKPKGKSKAHK